MNANKIIPLALLTFLLMATTAQAFNGPSPEQKQFLGAKHIAKMQKELNLTDDQATKVKQVFSRNKQAKEDILQKHNLKLDDLKNMRKQIKAANKDGFRTLQSLLSKTQMHTLRTEILHGNPWQFAQTSMTQKITTIQQELHLNNQEARQLAQILTDGHKNNQQILKKNNLTPAQMQAFHQDIQKQQTKMTQELRIILTPEQMSKFEKMQGPHRPPSSQGSFFKKDRMQE